MGVQIAGRDKTVGSALRGVRLFADWPIAPMQQVREAAQLWSYDAGEVLLKRGDRPVGVWAVAAGSIRTYRESPAGYFLQGVHWPGDVFGLTAAIDGFPSPFWHAARTDCIAILIPRTALEAILGSNAEVALSVSKFLCARTRVEFEGVFSGAVEPLRCRVARYLAYVPGRSLLISEEPIDAPGWKDAAPVELTQEEMAAALGVARQTLNRTIGSFISDGIVRREGASIHVVDFKGLIAVIEEAGPLSRVWRALLLSWDEKRRSEEHLRRGGSEAGAGKDLPAG